MSKIRTPLVVLVALLAFGVGSAEAGSPRAAMEESYGGINWSGIYVGVHGGWMRPDIRTTDAAIFGEPFPSIGPDSAALGFQVGVQHQFGKLVVGLEGGLTAPVGGHYETKDFETLPGDDTVFRAGIDNIWFVGPRIGYAMGNWMPYVTGGYASTSVKAQNIQFGVPVVFWDERMHGWYLGAGLDWAIARNWTLAVDYRHYDFGDKVVIPTANGAPDPFDAAAFDVKADAITLRLSYRFGREDPIEPLK